MATVENKNTFEFIEREEQLKFFKHVLFSLNSSDMPTLDPFHYSAPIEPHPIFHLIHPMIEPNAIIDYLLSAAKI